MPGAEHKGAHGPRRDPESAGGADAAESAELLERALNYALCSARTVGPTLLGRPTPCREWDLEMLLRHANDSLAALREAAETDGVSMWPSTEPPSVRGDPADAFRSGAANLLAVVGGVRRATVAVSGLPLATAVVARTGALEVAVHGWDIARAAGLPRPIPAALAVRLLHTARELVPPPECRHPLFAPPVPVPPGADPGDRLIAYLGREPHAS